MEHPNFHRQAVLLALSVPIAAWIALMPPIPQSLAYHDFADHRTLFGIRHFWNVISNLPFAVIGLAGCWWLLRTGKNSGSLVEPWERSAYFVFFFAEFLTCFGSAYYHANPNNQTLVWDRSVFILLLAAFFPVIVTEFVHRRAGRWLLAPLVLLALASVLYWRQTGDLRLYVLIHGYPVLAIPVIFLLFRSRYTHTGAQLLAWALFAVAKLCEFFDVSIYQLTGVWSGHTFKHFVAAASTYAVLFGLQRRAVRDAPKESESNPNGVFQMKGLAS